MCSSDLVAFDETVTVEEVGALVGLFGGTVGGLRVSDLGLVRQSPFLTHPTFSRYHSETEMLRYITRLQTRDLSLAFSMIPLGSCTMKLNATTEMLPVTWAGIGQIHPFAPGSQTKGYQELFTDLEAWLAEITGFEIGRAHV